MKQTFQLLFRSIGSMLILSSFVSNAQVLEVEEAPQAEEEHVHDENCDHGPAEQKGPSRDEMKAFLKENAPYILPEFEKLIEAGNEEHVDWMMRDIARFMAEHAEFSAYDPKLAALFSEVNKLEFSFHGQLENKLESGVAPEKAILEVKPILSDLIEKRIHLRQGQVRYQKSILDKEIEALEISKAKVGEITGREMKELLNEIKQVHGEEGKPESAPEAENQ